MTELYKTDNPISKSNEDKFQRYTFSKRIADTIKNRIDFKSLVVGIYGSWGEGKTSVLNFIESELDGRSDIVVCNFNPWRFKDETELLNGFFTLLAKELGKSLTKKHERAAKVLSGYAESLNAALGGASWIGKITNKLLLKAATLSVESAKKRVEKLLETEKKRIVIFIDDIDRLEKKDIQSIFKLIKLTADFNYTAYILAFDDKMVAHAIGEIYGEGNEEAGHNFLEKIIQVPLRIPSAHIDALQKFCFTEVENAIKLNGIEFQQGEADKFGKHFITFFLKKVSTPRMALRYGNSLSFVLPLLYKNANTVDIMLIEAVKLFFPRLYNFIKENPNLFIKTYNYNYEHWNSKHDDRKEKLIAGITELSKIYFEGNIEKLQKLLVELFPVLNEVFHNYVYNEKSYSTWHHEKRIGSAQYFDRYFSYCVLEGDISDIEFDEYLNKLDINSTEANVVLTENFLSKVVENNFIHKLLYKLDIVSIELKKELAICLSHHMVRLPSSPRTLFSIDTSFGLSAHLVFKVIEALDNETSRFDLSKELIIKIANLDFAFEIMRSFRNDADRARNESVITNQHFDELSSLLLERTLEFLSGKPIFDVFPEQTPFLLSKTWYRILGSESLMNYIKNILNNEPEKIYSLLKSYCNLVFTSRQNEPYYGDLEKDTFEWLDKVFDCSYLYTIATNLIGNQQDYMFVLQEEKQTDENRLKQFIFFYLQKNMQRT